MTAITNATQRIQARDHLIEEARKYMGATYKLGGDGPSYDCSGLVKKVAHEALNVNLFRTSQKQWKMGPGKLVTADKLFRGDLVFCDPTGGKDARHVGIYTGNGMMINAQSGAGKVKETSIKYFGTILGGRRLIHK
jgi:cell wall-associated NlpC family hydrolase